MGLILSLETATTVCSVALASDGVLVAENTTPSENDHAALLIPFIDRVLTSGGFTTSSLDAIAVSMGPGSYTGLRIGVATAKGLCYALNIPLIAVPTLQSLALGLKNAIFNDLKTGNSAPLLCPMLDARRMEVYSGLYDMELRETREVKAEIIDGSSFGKELENRVVIFGGSGSVKCKSILSANPHAVFLDNSSSSATCMIGFAEERFKQGLFENIAYFEPFYLKDFVAGKPRVKGLDT